MTAIPPIYDLEVNYPKDFWVILDKTRILKILKRQNIFESIEIFGRENKTKNILKTIRVWGKLYGLVGILAPLIVLIPWAGAQSLRHCIIFIFKYKKNIAKGASDLGHWVLWLIQHLLFKAEASTSFEILVKVQLGFVWKRARKNTTTLTNPWNYLNKSM